MPWNVMPPQVDESLRISSAVLACDEFIGRLIAASFDPKRAAQYFREFRARNHAAFERLAGDSARLTWLATIFGLSRFLSDEVLRHPDWILDIADLQEPFTAAVYKVRLNDFLSSHRKATALTLVLFRHKELLRIVLRDGLGLGTVAECTEEISYLADSILECALETVTKDLLLRHGSPRTENDRGEPVPAVFSVLALGKLGGRELNYSSDIDLMFLHSGDGETDGSHRISNREFFKKVANQFTKLLSTYTAAGVCYRVDLRLRPEGSLGEVCLSLRGAENYYSERARDWELQMLIKARVVAGDIALGQHFLHTVEPLIYSTTLDFTTIESMSATRERIGEKLARKRLRQGQLDVKLARGGIRDVEFLVQCLQRLHGARDSSIQHGGTLFALSSLLSGDLLSESEHGRLRDAYQFLRNLEHRLQLEDDRQTHTLPTEGRELERIARRMARHPNSPLRTASSVQLLQTLHQHLENVQLIYDRIVHSQRPLRPGTFHAAPVSPPKTLIQQTPLFGPSTKLMEHVERICPTLAARVHSGGFRHLGGVLEAFLKSLSKQPSYLAMLGSNPRLACYLLQILEWSPFLAEQLTLYPKLIDEVRRLADYPAARPAFEALASPLSDTDGLRRFFRREMFRIQAASICSPESVFQTLDRTSGLAEFLVARAYRIALEQGLAHARAHAIDSQPFIDPQSQMMVVALGRLGLREFDLDSDADLLFIIPDSETPRQRFWTRVAERLIEILTAYSEDGPMLSIDTRLRPNGREGVLVQTESNYVDYFSGHAEAWEGIAYMKARAVAGDTERAITFLTQLQQVDWRRYGQGGRSRQDLRQMRIRLQREQGSSSPLRAAEGGYYDADFILMYLRLKGAGMFFTSLNTPERIDIVEKMGHLDRGDAEFLSEATTFYRAVDHALRIVTGRAEERLPNSAAELDMAAGLVQLWTGKPLVGSTLGQELKTFQHRMRELFDSVFH